MARLRGSARTWDRFARIPPLAARLLLLLTVLLLVAAALTARADPPQAAAPISTGPDGLQAGTQSGIGRDTDLQLYDRITQRVAAGEDYHAAAVEEQRIRDFPVRPGLAVRLPTLAHVSARLGESGMMVAAGLLWLAVIAAWWRRLGQEPGGARHRIAAVLLLVIGAAMGVKPQYLALHEVWAGMFIALSLALYRPGPNNAGIIGSAPRDSSGRWVGAWLAAGAALAIREHALPFVLLLGALAVWRGSRREVIAWALMVLLFLIGLTQHLAETSQYVLPSDPPSPSWLALRGLGGWTGNIVQSSSLHLLPAWLAAPLALLPLLGWASWRSDLGLVALLLYAGYGVAFMIAGRDNNFYWALVITPAWFVGLALVPGALVSLWGNARRA